MKLNFEKIDRFIREYIELARVYEFYEPRGAWFRDSFIQSLCAALKDHRPLSSYCGPFWCDNDEYYKSLWDYKKLNNGRKPAFIKVTKKYKPKNQWSIFADGVSCNPVLMVLGNFISASKSNDLRFYEWARFTHNMAVDLLAIGLKSSANYRESEALFDRLSGRGVSEYEYYFNDDFYSK